MARRRAANTRQYLDKRLFVQLNGSRKVIGVLRGYDVRSRSSFARGISVQSSIMTGVGADLIMQLFLNIVLDDAVEEKDGGEKVRIGTVVIRGNSVVMLEVLYSLCLLTWWILCSLTDFSFSLVGFRANNLDITSVK
jgi:small nuclear ribonucleoprotein G